MSEQQRTSETSTQGLHAVQHVSHRSAFVWFQRVCIVSTAVGELSPHQSHSITQQFRHTASTTPPQLLCLITRMLVVAMLLGQVLLLQLLQRSSSSAECSS
jgi:hypothetical protein